MKNYELTLRLPFSIRAMDVVEEAAARLPMKTSVKRDGSEIHVNATASGYDMDGAYRYLWKELAIRLATAKLPDPDEPDEWEDLLSAHAMQLRGIVEKFAELYPQAESVMDYYGIREPDIAEQPVLLAMRALCVTAQEMLDALTGESGKAPPPELVDQLNLSEGVD